MDQEIYKNLGKEHNTSRPDGEKIHGMGLAIAIKYMKDNNIQFECKSEKGFGTKWTLNIPYDKEISENILINYS
jgi:sensor histidine kinase regulating citrate/malate metabolism